jgi:AraC family transcriptional regulator
MGEALGDYVRRRRLEIAGVRLLSQHGISVLNIALEVGFGSAEAFTRAFRARFKCSPTEWRKSKAGQMARKRGQSAGRTRRKNGVTTPKETAMKVTILERPPVHVAYLRHTGPYGAGIGRFWMENVAPWMSTNNLMGRERFGIALDDPTVTAPAKCRYDACVQSDAKEMLSGDPGRKMIPGGKYAALAFEGTSDGIGAAWEALLREWLPKSGLQLDSRPFFEHYPVDGRYDPKTGSFTCNICVPVKPL